MKQAKFYAPKDIYYNNHIKSLTENENSIYPTREYFDDYHRKNMRLKFPNEVIEGVEKIGGKTVPVWYFYDEG